MNNYYTIHEAEQFVFYRIPKALITDKIFSMVSTDAKLLYGLLLDRMGLSAKNGWCDESGRVYIYYTVDAVREDLSCGKEKACKLFEELESVDLIERKRKGQGKPSRIYLKRFRAEVGNSDFKTFEKPTSKSRKPEPQEVGKADGNDIKKTISSFSKNDQSIRRSDYESMESLVKENLDYNILWTNAPDYERENIDEIIDFMVDTLLTTAPTVRIGKEDKPTEVVRSQLLKLNSEHISYVQECLQKNTTKVRNIRSYLLTALYNAPLSINHYYTAEVMHDEYALRL